VGEELVTWMGDISTTRKIAKKVKKCLSRDCTSWCISRTGAGSGLDPMWSNMFPKSSSSELSNARSESNNLGGVAVLAVLSVTVLFLLLSMVGGYTAGASGEAGASPLPFNAENEKVLTGLRRKLGRFEPVGNTETSLADLAAALCVFFSDFVSMEDGFVEEVLRRAEDAALS
jgi:hypothetical protein